MKTIQVGSNGHVMTVDDDDYEVLNQYTWRIVTGYRTSYAATRVAGKTAYAHRLLMQQELIASDAEHPVVDHLSGDGLDNRRANLKVCSQAANCQRQRLSRRSKTGYRGVCRLRNGRYRASIGHQMRDFYIGCFATAEEAFDAYCERAKKLYGDAMPELTTIMAPVQ